jgi:hypothetical protein
MSLLLNNAVLENFQQIAKFLTHSPGTERENQFAAAKLLNFTLFSA